MTPSWKEVARLKQAERAQRVATARKLLEDQGSAGDESGDEVYLTVSAAVIVKNIERGQWTASRVIFAYIRQAIKAHEKTNCLTEILFEQAMKDAALLDAEFAATKRVKGPLHGVPMTFKDCFEIEGTDATVGFTRWAFNPSTSSGALVSAARAHGAIIIAKTNVPQTMFSFECSNPLFGRAINPYSAEHTCGGSSGGEAAVLAQNGSALGIGTDIGGSLRIPAGYCGVYSLKPGAGRMSRAGTVATIPGFESLNAVAGPMARTCEDVELACRVLFGVPGEPHELATNAPYVDPAPLPQKLRFGYYTSDNFCKASPACARAVHRSVEALRKHGHECVEFDPHLAVDAMVLFAAIMSADGYKTMQSHLGPDPKESSLFLPTLGPRLPGFVRSTAAWLIRNLVGDEGFARCLEASRSKSAQELYAVHAERDKLRKRWYEEVWEKYQFDGIIAPVQASPAMPHGATTTLTPLAAMTILYNVIDSPVGLVPVSRVDPSLDALPLPDAWSKEPGHGSKLVEHELYFKTSKGKDGVKRAVYDAEAMKGLPVAVQIVGKSGEDEKVLKMMRVVDDALEVMQGKGAFGPSAWKE